MLANRSILFSAEVARELTRDSSTLRNVEVFRRPTVEDYTVRGSALINNAENLIILLRTGIRQSLSTLLARADINTVIARASLPELTAEINQVEALCDSIRGIDPVDVEHALDVPMRTALVGYNTQIRRILNRNADIILGYCNSFKQLIQEEQRQRNFIFQKRIIIGVATFNGFAGILIITAGAIILSGGLATPLAVPAAVAATSALLTATAPAAAAASAAPAMATAVAITSGVAAGTIAVGTTVAATTVSLASSKPGTAETGAGEVIDVIAEERMLYEDYLRTKAEFEATLASSRLSPPAAEAAVVGDAAIVPAAVGSVVVQQASIAPTTHGSMSLILYPRHATAAEADSITLISDRAVAFEIPTS